MTCYYKAWYGNWKNDNVIRHLEGSYSRKDIFDRAQKTANETGQTVTIEAKRGTYSAFYKVDPKA